jgi:hypothetical protein
MVVAVEKLAENATENTALSGLARLAFEPVNDAVRLMARMETMTDREIAKLNLLAVSEIRRLKDGALEMKFFDRLKAFELLASYTARPEGSASATSFYAALENAAKTVCDADAV